MPPMAVTVLLLRRGELLEFNYTSKMPSMLTRFENLAFKSILFSRFLAEIEKAAR